MEQTSGVWINGKLQRKPEFEEAMKRSSTLSRMPLPTNATIQPETMNYKFLVEKQIEIIKSGQQKYRDEHKKRKQQMMNFMESAQTLEDNLAPIINNKKEMRKVLTDHIENGNTEELFKPNNKALTTGIND